MRGKKIFLFICSNIGKRTTEIVINLFQTKTIHQPILKKTAYEKWRQDVVAKRLSYRTALFLVSPTKWCTVAKGVWVKNRIESDLNIRKPHLGFSLER